MSWAKGSTSAKRDRLPGVAMIVCDLADRHSWYERPAIRAAERDHHVPCRHHSLRVEELEAERVESVPLQEAGLTWTRPSES